MSVANRLERLQGISFGVVLARSPNITWWVGILYALLSNSVVWEFEIWLLLIRPSWANSYGVLVGGDLSLETGVGC